jgi:hypothetical protein
VLTDAALRETLVAAGRRRVRDFDLGASAAKLRTIIESVVS